MLDVLGIINMADDTVDVSGLQDYRPISAVSILGRYRIIDFILSNMTNSGINNVHVYCREKPRSLIEHLGTGLHYNINSKKGSLRVLYGECGSTNRLYNNDISNFMANIEYVESSDKRYVILAPSHFIYLIDLHEAINFHKENENDITVLYKATDNAKEKFIGCDCVTLDKEKRVISIEKNRGKYKNRNISTEAYIMSRQLFIDIVKKAQKTSSLYWFKDIISDILEEYKIVGYAIKKPVYCINSLSAYFDLNMECLDPEKIQLLHSSNWPIHTMTSDSSPTVYGQNCSVKNSLVANGCHIDGHVENCIIGRNVTIKKGSVIKNSVLLHNVYIAEDTTLNYAVVDKQAIINHVKKLNGTSENPVYVKRRDRI